MQNLADDDAQQRRFLGVYRGTERGMLLALADDGLVDGDVVRATSLHWNATLAPGERTTFGFVGATPSGTAAPSLVTLNGFPCASA